MNSVRDVAQDHPLTLGVILLALYLVVVRYQYGLRDVPRPLLASFTSL